MDRSAQRMHPSFMHILQRNSFSVLHDNGGHDGQSGQRCLLMRAEGAACPAYLCAPRRVALRTQ